jgi:hypothetical protein
MVQTLCGDIARCFLLEVHKPTCFFGFLPISTSGHGQGRGGFGPPLYVIVADQLGRVRQGLRLLSRIDHIYDFLYDVCMHSWLSAWGALEITWTTIDLSWSQVYTCSVELIIFTFFA